MNYVRAAIDWIKNNPITLGCVIVAVISMVSFIYPTHSMASAFRQSLAARSSELSKIQGLQKTEIAVPPPDAAAGEGDKDTGVVTAADTKELERIYSAINSEYKGVVDFVLRFNKE